MSSATQSAINEPLQHFVLDGVSYQQFVAMTDALGERPGLRVSFDGRRLELMTLSRRHERWKNLLGALVRQLTIELDIPLESGGETTFRNQLVERGLEPDDCFWVQHAETLIGVTEWDPLLHPPPDLAIEIDVSRSSVNRLEIYAKLGVEEVWVFDGRALSAFQLDGPKYSLVEQSIAFSFLTVKALEPFLLEMPGASETEILRTFLKWLRSQTFPRNNPS